MVCFVDDYVYTPDVFFIVFFLVNAKLGQEHKRKTIAAKYNLTKRVFDGFVNGLNTVCYEIQKLMQEK